MPALSQRIELHQAQKLSPRLQQAVRLLQLSSLDFMQEVHAMIDANPFLEGGDAEAPHEAQDAEREPWMADGRGAGLSRASTDGGDLESIGGVAVTVTLVEHLHRQLNMLKLPLRDAVLAKALVGSLDDDGYLRTPLDEIAAMADLSPPASLEEMRIALRRVQSLEPTGVAARDVEECLLLQAAEVDEPALRSLAMRIVADHLDALAASRDPAPLARQLREPVEAVRRACDRIRRLDPHPGWRFGSPQVQYITPDVLVKKVRGAWTASLNPTVFPRVRLNQHYADLFHRHRGPGAGELAGHLREARWAVTHVQQRFSTILEVACAIIERQAPFLEYGAMAMKPLSLREIATVVGVHESTVSRVTNNKYMATRHGVFELKFFFSRAMTARSGAAFSGTAVRGLVGEIIAAETPGEPLSDADIARLLAQQGLTVARRTVTKYRQQLKLEPVEKRRHGAA
ncbi:MAG: RNA polymerase factor sigma-54 [Rhizobacter sp.]